MRNALMTMLAGLLMLWAAAPVRAIVDPRSVANNRFGSDIVDEGDLERAAEWVNSNGGAWGYVTVVMRADDRNREKWQRTFERMRELKLIPIVRLATSVEGGVWKKAAYTDLDEVRNWVEFLNSLGWVVKNRYVVLFNEPNHAKEWGATISPDEYAKTVRVYHDFLKAASADFFILPAGMDLAASKTPVTMAANDYWKGMYRADPDVFKLFDGFVSHSYPNPGFSGSVWERGQRSVRGFEWEVDYLRGYGLADNLPVFITETGWAHSEGVGRPSRGYLNSAVVADNLKTAFTSIWDQSNIVAVTPFILNYQDVPFDNFSWTRPGGGETYPQYQAVAELPKTRGQPEQVFAGEAGQGYLPDTLATKSEYKVALKFLNTGQAIWEDKNVEVRLSGQYDRERVSVEQVATAKPGQVARVWLDIKTTENEERMSVAAVLWRGDRALSSPISYEMAVRKPTLLIRIKLLIEKLLNQQDLVGNESKTEARD